MELPPIQHYDRPVFISGHRNPDVDSIMSAYALAALKHALGQKNVTPICPGILPDRAAWIFDHFKLQPPQCRNDVYLRIRDIMKTDFPHVTADLSLFDAVRKLKDTGCRRGRKVRGNAQPVLPALRPAEYRFGGRTKPHGTLHRVLHQHDPRRA